MTSMDANINDTKLVMTMTVAIAVQAPLSWDLGPLVAELPAAWFKATPRRTG